MLRNIKDRIMRFIKKYRKTTSLIAILSICLAIGQFYLDLSSKNNSERNLNMNYVLKSSKIKPAIIRLSDGTVHNIRPYSYSISSISGSGEYLNIFFARFGEDGLIIKEIGGDGILVYYDDIEDTELIDKIGLKDTDMIKNDDISIFYAKPTLNVSISMNHIFLKGYNGTYQFFTIINYVSKLKNINTIINGENYNDFCVAFDTEIITDEEVYDSDILKNIIVKIQKSEYSKDNPFVDYKELQSKIIDERNKIKESLK